MVPKFESKEEMKSFLGKKLSEPNPEFISSADLLRIVYQFLDLVPTEEEIDQMVDDSVSDKLENIEFEAVDLKIIGR